MEIIDVIHRVAGGVDSDKAERASQAVLQTLAERLRRGEAKHLLPPLAEEQRDVLTPVTRERSSPWHCV